MIGNKIGAEAYTSLDDSQRAKLHSLYEAWCEAGRPSLPHLTMEQKSILWYLAALRPALTDGGTVQ